MGHTGARGFFHRGGTYGRTRFFSSWWDIRATSALVPTLRVAHFDWIIFYPQKIRQSGRVALADRRMCHRLAVVPRYYVNLIRQNECPRCGNPATGEATLCFGGKFNHNTRGIAPIHIE